MGRLDRVNSFQLVRARTWFEYVVTKLKLTVQFFELNLLFIHSPSQKWLKLMYSLRPRNPASEPGITEPKTIQVPSSTDFWDEKKKKKTRSISYCVHTNSTESKRKWQAKTRPATRKPVKLAEKTQRPSKTRVTTTKGTRTRALQNSNQQLPSILDISWSATHHL